MDKDRGDIPKIVATVGVKIPGLMLRFGVAYLRMKRDSNRASKRFTSRLEREGLPPELAKKLGESYGSELSIRKLLSGGKGFSLVSSFKDR